ncbi:helix-turn-helix domain-containing protein [Microbacterium sp. 22303]|uniref:helix-turn-helix domain-containing protein n=1 Tax=Microbacterium sp. 22303 TaxID=3453905 RepID=UPI003F878EF2
MSSLAPSTWEEYAKVLGIELQRQRIQRNLSQEALAHRAGLTCTHYQQLERGYWKPGSPANPSLKILARLAQVLDLEIGDLMPPVTSLHWPEESSFPARSSAGRPQRNG